MKTSNKILLFIALLGIGWIVVRSFMLVQAIPSMANGKLSPYANVLGRSDNSALKPFSKLTIIVDGNVSVTIKQSKNFKIEGVKDFMKNVTQHYSKSELTMSYKNNSKRLGEIQISCPAVSCISLLTEGKKDNALNVVVSGFNQDSLLLKGSYLSNFLLTECILNHCNLDISMASQKYDLLNLSKSNQIQNLTITCQGKGNLNLESIGTLSNNLQISDSTNVSVKGNLLQKLYKNK